MKRLVKLPSGTWIDPHLVTIIEVHRGDAGKDDRVIVHFTTDAVMTFKLKSFDLALTLADMIAIEVNRVAEDE